MALVAIVNRVGLVSNTSSISLLLSSSNCSLHVIPAVCKVLTIVLMSSEDILKFTSSAFALRNSSNWLLFTATEDDEANEKVSDLNIDPDEETDDICVVERGLAVEERLLFSLLLLLFWICAEEIREKSHIEREKGIRKEKLTSQYG